MHTHTHLLWLCAQRKQLRDKTQVQFRVPAHYVCGAQKYCHSVCLVIQGGCKAREGKAGARQEGRKKGSRRAQRRLKSSGTERAKMSNAVDRVSLLKQLVVTVWI